MGGGFSAADLVFRAGWALGISSWPLGASGRGWARRESCGGSAVSLAAGCPARGCGCKQLWWGQGGFWQLRTGPEPLHT